MFCAYFLCKRAIRCDVRREGQGQGGLFEISEHSLLKLTWGFCFAFGIWGSIGGMDPRCCLSAQTERCFGQKPCCSFVLFSGAYLRALTVRLMETLKAKCKALFSSRGWFGCFKEPSRIIKVDKPSKGPKIQGPRLSEDFWSSSGIEMECSSGWSRRSFSSTGISNQPLDPSGSTSHPSEFVNHGLLLWNQTRQQWFGNKRSEKQAQHRKPTISWNAIDNSLQGSNKPFPQPVPLPEMVDFLVDVWEQEGLYD